MIVCIAIAANKIPTNRDITVEMVKLNNRDAHDAEKNIAQEITCENKLLKPRPTKLPFVVFFDNSF